MTIVESVKRALELLGPCEHYPSSPVCARCILKDAYTWEREKYALIGMTASAKKSRASARNFAKARKKRWPKRRKGKVQSAGEVK